MLAVKGLSYGPPGAITLQRGLHFTLAPGELLHVRGENGSGKSLLARVILSDLAPRDGSVTNSFAGVRYLPQIQNRAAHLPFSLGEIIEGSNWQKSALLKKEHLFLAWNKASGGERQRTLLTRLFAGVGDLLVIDEPFNHLDSAAKARVQVLIRELLEHNPKCGVFLISHNDHPAEWMGKVMVKTLDLRRADA